MAKKVQLMTNPKQWQVIDGVEVLVDVPQEDIDPVVDSSCVEIEGHRTLEETISQDNMFTPKIIETKVHSKVGGVYHDNVVDGAYEEAILYGNTQVNLVESETTGTKYIPHSFTSFQGNESKIGNYNSRRTNQVAPLVKGVTMVNLCQQTSVTIPYQHTRAVASYNAKPNTKYTLKCKFTEKNKNAGIMIQSYGYNDGTWGYIEISKTIQNLGDDVLLTFTTHEQADSIIIYNSPAFCADENDSITLDDIMVIEGDVTDLDLPFFKGMRSVELSRPLINLFTDDTTSSYPVANANGTVTVTSDSIGSWKSVNFFLQDSLKPNTKYIVMWDSLTATQTSVGTTIINTYDIVNNTSLKASDSDIISPTLRSYVFDTGNVDVNDIVIRIHATTSNSETGTTTVKGLRVFEWDDTLRTLDLQTIGYFSGTKYVSAPKTLETEGKNLYPYGDVSFTGTNTNVDSWYDHKGTTFMHGDIALKSKSRFLLKQGTYTITTGVWVNATACQLIDDKEQIAVKLDLGQRNHVFTLSQDTYCTLRIKASVVNTVTQIPNIQIERGETATSYEAYQGRYYKPRETEEIILRSLPNGVCDTFNLQTGELVQKIYYLTVKNGFTVLSNFTTDTHATFAWSLSANNVQCKNNMVFYSNYPSATTYTTDSVEGVAINSAGNQLTMRIAKSKYASYETFNGYLTDNPLIIQYELKEPIITKLQTYNRVYNGQTNALASMGNNLSALTYYSNNYYLKVGNLSPVPGILEPITSIPYDVRLKPSTLYTIKYDRGGYSNSMKFDLGGSVVEKTNATSLGIVPEELTVRTPAILSHEQLILSGTGYAHKFIVVEGDITGTELPYFQGMKDVKMPIVKNIGKNLFDGELYIDMGINANGTTVYGLPQGMSNSPDWVTTKNLIPITKGKKISITIDADDEDITSNRRYVYVYKYDMNGNFIANDRYDLGLNTKTYTMNHYGYIRCTIRTHNVKNITITETDTPQPCIDYRVNSIYAVQGEYPITSEMIEQGGFSMSGSSDGSYEKSKYDNTARLRSKDLIPVKPNTTYAFAHSFSKFAYNIYQWNGNKKFMDGVTQYFNSGQIETITTTADTQYIHFLMSKHDASQAITVAEYDWSQFHMYELDSTINLRSLPNGVKDELNLLTGEYIQRVGEIVLDENENWSQDITASESTPNTNIFYTAKHQDFKPLATAQRESGLLCDKMKVIASLFSLDVVGAMTNLDPRAYIRLPKNVAPNVTSLKAYLQSNPITLQYELAEPIISHVRLVSNNQEREVGVKLPNGVSDTYNPSTGITTVRVGKVVLDGSEDEGWKTAADNSGGAFRFETLMLSGKFNGATSDMEVPILLCDKYATYKFYDIYRGNAVGITFYYSSHIVIYDNKYADLASFKQALKSDPITLWYELKYPQIQPNIVLPNGVHDEYNPETGVYTKRVGFIELDGNEKFNGPYTAGATVQGMYYYSYDLPVKRNTNTKQLTTISSGGMGSIPFASLWLLEQEGISSSNSTGLGLRFATKCATASELQQYFTSNPTKVWYELETPITYQLTPYFGLPQPYAYEDGYLIHDSAYAETTLPPEFKYKLVANRTGQVMQNSRKLQEHTTRLSNLEALIIEATIQSLFDRELQTFELELMDVQLIDLGE